MKLGTYFTLEELTVTNSGLVNVPSSVEIESLKRLVEFILDPARKKFGVAIKVNSGYRSPAVNKAVGGAVDKNGNPTSQHCKGEAADLSCSDNAKLFNIIKNEMNFDELIWEKGNNKQPAWVHVSKKATGNRNQVLKFDGKKYVQL